MPPPLAPTRGVTTSPVDVKCSGTPCGCQEGWEAAAQHCGGRIPASARYPAPLLKYLIFLLMKCASYI